MANCLECGAELINIPGKRPKQFCNVTHRSNYWQKQKRLAAKETEPKVKLALYEGAPTPGPPPGGWPKLDPETMDGTLLAGKPFTIAPKSFQDYLREAAYCQNPVAFVKALMADKSLTPGQRDMIRAKIQPEKIK